MTRSASEDLALVARCKRELPHHHEAFEKLVGAYKRTLYNLCYRMSGTPQDAEDLLQEVLLRLFLNIHSFDGKAAFSSWLYRVAYNHCLNFLAKNKQQRSRNETLSEEPPDPRSIMIEKDGLAQHVLEQLETTDRSLLVMKYILELDVRQISETLGISASAVKMRLLRAREQFKKRYESAK
jgi:RNA polymerase sigma factor (sigma-70 family)